MRTMIKRALLLSCLLPLLAMGANPNPSQGKVFNTPTAPVNGTNEIQTLTFAGTITGGTFILSFNNRQTGPISWSSTNNTLRDAIDSALEGLSSIGTSGVTTAVGVMTAGIGTITVTFSGSRVAKLDVSELIRISSLTGSGASLTVSTSTPGVTADGRTSNAGTLCVAQDTGSLYVNLGTSPNPNWTSLATP